MIGDTISRGQGRAGSRTELDWLFLVAAALGCVSFAAAWFATAREVRPPRQRRLPLGILLRRYHPRALLLMAIVMGVAIGMPATFLRTFAAELSINRLAPFFTVYALTAIATRLATRRVIDEFGIRPAVIMGTAAIAVRSGLIPARRRRMATRVSGTADGRGTSDPLSSRGRGRQRSISRSISRTRNHIDACGDRPRHARWRAADRRDRRSREAIRGARLSDHVRLCRGTAGRGRRALCNNDPPVAPNLTAAESRKELLKSLTARPARRRRRVGVWRIVFDDDQVEIRVFLIVADRRIEVGILELFGESKTVVTAATGRRADQSIPVGCFVNCSADENAHSRRFLGKYWIIGGTHVADFRRIVLGAAGIIAQVRTDFGLMPFEQCGELPALRTSHQRTVREHIGFQSGEAIDDLLFIGKRLRERVKRIRGAASRSASQDEQPGRRRHQSPLMSLR